MRECSFEPHFFLIKLCKSVPNCPFKAALQEAYGDSLHLLRTSSVLSTIVGFLYILTHIIFTITLGSKYYYCPHFKSKRLKKEEKLSYC